MYCDSKSIKRRLLMVDALARTSNVERQIPTSIAELCERYWSDAVYWTIGRDELEYLLSHHSAEFSNRTMKYGEFEFNLHLRNERDSIIFEVVPVHSTSQCAGFIYSELYCLETQSQHKYTFLFHCNSRGSSARSLTHERLHLRRYPSLQWTTDHLKGSDVPPQQQRLTFSFRPQILTESDFEGQRPLNDSEGPNARKIEYLWNLDGESGKHKVYSPNFGGDAWCLWMTPSADRENNVIGLQLFKCAPPNKGHGIMFRCKIEREGYEGRTIDFVYHLDLTHCQVEIGNVKRGTKWIRVEIEKDTV